MRVNLNKSLILWKGAVIMDSIEQKKIYKLCCFRNTKYF
jgi:hypothetical protein